MTTLYRLLMDLYETKECLDKVSGDIGNILSRFEHVRSEAERRLEINPDDIDAKTVLAILNNDEEEAAE